MYQPPQFREERPEFHHALMRAHSLAMLITMGEGGLTANPVPLLLDTSVGEKGTLRGHLSRANAQWRNYDPSVECLAIFQGTDAYITPSYYAAKRETGKVVPTWNYVVVQAYGRMTVRDDQDWLRRQVQELTEEHEQARSEPWQVSDAPSEYIEAQLRGIVGIEIEITRIEGKWKVSQNRSDADITGVIDGLRSEERASSAEMATLVEQFRPKRSR